jgi:Flp pilus assembly protein TadD
MLMDALKKAERAKPHMLASTGQADMSLELLSSLDQGASSCSFEETREAGSNKSEKNVFVAKISKNTLPQHIKYFITIASCVFFLFLVAGYAYYQSILNSLPIDMFAVVSPVAQQKQLSLKDMTVPRVGVEQQDQMASPEKKQVAVEKKITSTIKATTRAKLPQKTPVISGFNSTSIKIEHQSAPDTVYQLLLQAYAAYQLGHDNEAISVYSKVLQQEKNNRDAMLGLAAISVRNVQYEKARDTYLAILDNNPQDSVAMSGLLNIQTNVDPGRSETQVKLLLDLNPGSPYLLFTLGSLYASQQRWAEAQEAFFRAYSSDSRNADLAYNLAVSLDQLEQREVALKYYRAALQLVKRQAVTFKVNDVIQRINVLQEVSAG